MADGGALLAVSDLHVEHPANRRIVEEMRPSNPGDWLLVAGDVASSLDRVEWALRLLEGRFSTVVWTPGNHELHAYPQDTEEPRGLERYRALVEICRSIGVVTPEDEFPVWESGGERLRVVPLFLLYDYSFGESIARSTDVALRLAYEAGVVCDDEFLLSPEPFRSRQEWCASRVAETRQRLLAVQPTLPTVLVNHFPLRIDETRALARPLFAQWCGTLKTAEWHRQFQAVAVVYGHLHIPRTTWHSSVPFEEVSLGYPRDHRPGQVFTPRKIWPR
jgi:3',5'-cyclic AMP phosphodiesterase CpdA